MNICVLPDNSWMLSSECQNIVDGVAVDVPELAPEQLDAFIGRRGADFWIVTEAAPGSKPEAIGLFELKESAEKYAAHLRGTEFMSFFDVRHAAQ